MWPFRRARFPPPRRFRYERFGGIAQLEWPRALVFVDRRLARRLGHRAPGERWDGREEGEGILSAPLEAHLQLTNRCAVGCQTCYTGATAAGERNEWGLAQWCRALDALAEAGVFHVALGGGESAQLPWLGEVAAHARRRGVVPNLTTSGLLDDGELERLADWAPLFGQINVSLDGLGDGYRRLRGVDGFAAVDRAIRRLRRATPHLGLNVVLSRATFDQLGELFAYAARHRLADLELLRLKPSGRGARVYDELRLDDGQHLRLLPTVLEQARRHRIRVRLDCSLTPFVAAHEPDPALLRRLAVYGCAGGDLLVAARAHGTVSACSFAAPPAGAPKVDGLTAYWAQGDAFAPFRDWAEAREPCRSCAYLALCRGGCRVVSSHVLGDDRAPDPECPRVLAHRRQEGPAPRRLRVLA